MAQVDRGRKGVGAQKPADVPIQVVENKGRIRIGRDDEATRFPQIGGTLSPHRFGIGLAAISLGALVLRGWYVLAVTRFQNKTLYDSFWYYSTTIGLHSGQFFRAPFTYHATAAHPPMTTLLLAAGTFLVGLHGGTTSSLLVMAVLGSVCVACVGLLGSAVAGPWVGLTAAALAAVAPNFWMPSGILMSETPTMLFTALLLLALVHVIRTPTASRAALVGLACGAVILTRAELVLFVPALLIPAILTVRGMPFRRRFFLLGIGLFATALVLSPWVGRNLSTFTNRTYISTGTGLVLLGANCPQTYSDNDLGLWSAQCAQSVKSKGDESVQSSRDAHAALDFVDHHLGQVPIVVLARVARLWDLYRPVQMAQVEAGEGRPLWASLAGLGVYYALFPIALAGIVILRRRRISQWFLLAPAGVVTVVSGLFYGLVRFRAPFEVCLVVLAAPAIVLLVSARRGRRPEGLNARRIRNGQSAALHFDSLEASRGES